MGINEEATYGLKIQEDMKVPKFAAVKCPLEAGYGSTESHIHIYRRSGSLTAV